MVSSISNFLSLAVQRALPQSARAQSGVSASNNSQQMVSILLSGLSKDSSQSVAGLSGQPDQLAQTLKQLSSAKDEMKAQKKEQARQKIQQIKAQIRALRMAAGGDPKMVERQAARLARELASAVRDYSGDGVLGGSSSSVFTAGAPASSEAGAVAPVTASAAQDTAEGGLATNVAPEGSAKMPEE